MKIFNFIQSTLKILILSTLYFYKRVISPFLPNACRFQPTCSEYMIEAIKIHGIFKGLILGIKRICRCHPWGESKYDPVETNKNKSTD